MRDNNPLVLTLHNNQQLNQQHGAITLTLHGMLNLAN